MPSTQSSSVSYGGQGQFTGGHQDELLLDDDELEEELLDELDDELELDEELLLDDDELEEELLDKSRPATERPAAPVPDLRAMIDPAFRPTHQDVKGNCDSFAIRVGLNRGLSTNKYSHNIVTLTLFPELESGLRKSDSVDAHPAYLRST